MNRDHALIRSEIESAKVNGLIHPARVVEIARSPKSPLHDCFTWDDSEAAAKWRLEEASRLIRVYVVKQDVGGSVVPVRAFVSLSSDRKGGGGYRTLADVMSDDALRAQMLADALDELRNMQIKYARVRELDPVFAAAATIAPIEEGSRSAIKKGARKVVARRVA